MKTLILTFKGLLRGPHTIKNVSIFLLVMLALGTVSDASADMVESVMLSRILYFAWLPLSLLFLIFRHGEVIKRWKMWLFFRSKSVKLEGFDERPPKYQGTEVVNSYLERVRFRSRIHAKVWEKKIPDLEMFFLSKIHKIKTLADDIRIIDLYIVKKNLPEFIPWDDSLMVPGRRFAVGEGYEGQVLWDTTAMPHGLVAGATGSGKTALVRCILHQAVQKGFRLAVLDFKGGWDFAGFGGTVISRPEEARDMLAMLLSEIRSRLAEFKKLGVSNLDEYNALGLDHYFPFLLAIDEAAEVFDVKPRDKADKELYTDIDQILRTLARMSRAAGVHILVGIIRPDHNVLDGQIKNNLLFRACGYFSDPAASRIVLDSDKATELPPDVKGRFVIGEEEVQAYFFPVPERREPGQ